MITFNQITIQYSDEPLLLSAKLTIALGDKVVIRGASGCGKSSLLKVLAGATPLSDGTVHVDDIQLTPATVSTIRSRIAYIGQEPVLGSALVKDALLLPFTFKAHKSRMPNTTQIHTLFEQLYLSPDLLTKPCAQISGGEKQRIAVIRALLLNKSIFLVDEVSSALDPQSRDAVMQALFQRDITLLSVSHDPAWIQACNRIIELKDKKLVEVNSEY